MSDAIGRKASLVAMLLIQIICLIIMMIFAELGSFWPFTIAIWVVTACFGGGFSVLPATLTDLFGSKNVGGCHGYVVNHLTNIMHTYTFYYFLPLLLYHYYHCMAETLSYF
jgi:MFS family permease